MENQVKVAIQEAKDRVAKKYGYPKWGALLSHFVDEDSLTTPKFIEMENEAMIEYASSKEKELDKAKIEIHRLSKKCGLIAKEATTPSSSGEKGGGEIKWVTSLVYQKIELGKLDSALRVIAVDARSEEEALGIGLKHFEKEMFGYTLLLKVAIQVALSHPSTKQFGVEEKRKIFQAGRKYGSGI